MRGVLVGECLEWLSFGEDAWSLASSVAANRLPADFDVWTDGGLVSGAASAGSGVCARLWEHFDDLRPTLNGTAAPCRGFCSLPGPLHAVPLGDENLNG